MLASACLGGVTQHLHTLHAANVCALLSIENVLSFGLMDFRHEGYLFPSLFFVHSLIVLFFCNISMSNATGDCI